MVVVVGVGIVAAWDASRQLPSGDGWRLIAHQRATGERNQVRLITDQAGLDGAADTMLLRSAPEAVDFERSVVLWLTPVGTISCTTRLDAVLFDRKARIVDVAFSLGLTMGCGSPPVGDSILVAIDRDRLPDRPYRIRILGPEPRDAAKGALDVSE